MTPPLLLFNPSFQTPKRPSRRSPRGARSSPTSSTVLRPPLRDANQHALVIGPRGFGKSTLMRRVVAELETHPELGALWEPVALPEEPYEVSSLGELWLEALNRLADSRRTPTSSASTPS
jgi:hypothetical protein